MKSILKTELLSGCLRGVADVNGVGGGNTYEIGGQYRNLAYAYNTSGFIQSRADSIAMQCETYTYDNLDRLSSYTVNGTQTLAFGYSPNGNITYNLMNRPASRTSLGIFY